jgi:hypothetical protein
MMGAKRDARANEGGVMGRLSATKDGDSRKKAAVEKRGAEEGNENGYAGKPVQTATKDDEAIVWDEV